MDKVVKELICYLLYNLCLLFLSAFITFVTNGCNEMIITNTTII